MAFPRRFQGIRVRGRMPTIWVIVDPIGPTWVPDRSRMGLVAAAPSGPPCLKESAGVRNVVGQCMLAVPAGDHGYIGPPAEARDGLRTDAPPPSRCTRPRRAEDREIGAAAHRRPDEPEAWRIVGGRSHRVAGRVRPRRPAPHHGDVRSPAGDGALSRAPRGRAVRREHPPRTSGRRSRTVLQALECGLAIAAQSSRAASAACADAYKDHRLLDAVVTRLKNRGAPSSNLGLAILNSPALRGCCTNPATGGVCCVQRPPGAGCVRSAGGRGGPIRR